MKRKSGRSLKIAAPPGTLIHTGDKKVEKVTISIIDYDQDHVREEHASSVEKCCVFKETSSITWINVNGLHEVSIIEDLGKCFKIHPLVLEDILNVDQRPKMEDFGDYVFIALKMLDYEEDKEAVESEQISMIIGKNFLITFQEGEGDVFDAIRERIKNSKGRIRSVGADYLAYTLMDAIVDHYFIILERIGDSIENIEDELMLNPAVETLNTIHNMKRKLITTRNSIWPLREIIAKLEKAESPFIQRSTAIYFRDIYDHTIQVIDTIETSRDMISGMIDIYLSGISYKLNEIMKVLTIIGTIFIPLTFITGIYGMNFRYMPEIEWKWGYPFVLLVMLGIGITMLIYFRRKKWF
ncbi:MAG: magnesium/cobalt transporter CorA [FCB group bacterium]|nr:magnesium/cobalt transporter CorA [FCB group bacterium]